MKRFIAGLLFPISILLMMLAHRSPVVTERVFSMGMYRFISATYGRLFNIFPFSVSQFLIIIFPILAVVYIFAELFIFIRFNTRKNTAKRFGLNVFCTIGVISILFTLGAGLNYARLELGDALGLQVKPSYVYELINLAEVLAEELNHTAPLVNRNKDGLMVLTDTDTARDAQAIFINAAEEFPVFAGFVPRPKAIIYSEFMSRLRITGVYSPFTMEAHVNVHVPDFHIPATMLHELAHFRGIMREDEANFTAWLMAKDSGNPDFMYSGHMLAFSHTRTQLRRASYEDYRRIMDSLHGYVRGDINANSAYWRQFTGTLAEISTQANDRYLRANRQQDGVASYGRMVDLMLAYLRK